MLTGVWYHIGVTPDGWPTARPCTHSGRAVPFYKDGDMPNEATIRQRGKPIRIRTKTLSNGRKLRIYVYDSRGKRGGHSTAEPIKKGK